MKAIRLDNEKRSDNVEDRRTPVKSSAAPGFPRSGSGGGDRNITLGGRIGLSWRSLLLLTVALAAFKLIFGIDLSTIVNDVAGWLPPKSTKAPITLPDATTDVSDAGDVGGGTADSDVKGDAGKNFAVRVLGSTERVWKGIFKSMGRQYEEPKLVLFTGFVESECGSAEAAIGPFYCAIDRKIYIDLEFYQEMKTKQGASGDLAEAYVIAHEVGHHVQNLLGIAGKVSAQRARVSDEESNMLSTRLELQADCFAGVWAREADKTSHILEAGDVDGALNAAAQVGDDKLQKRIPGFVVPESFTHGTAEQRVRWLMTGLAAEHLDASDTFGANQP